MAKSEKNIANVLPAMIVAAALLVFLCLSVRDWLDMPVVEKDARSKVCVRILLKGVEHDCSVLHTLGRYDTVYVAPKGYR